MVRQSIAVRVDCVLYRSIGDAVCMVVTPKVTAVLEHIASHRLPCFKAPKMAKAHMQLTAVA
jgi:hypothetical protein